MMNEWIYNEYWTVEKKMGAHAVKASQEGKNGGWRASILLQIVTGEYLLLRPQTTVFIQYQNLAFHENG